MTDTTPSARQADGLFFHEIRPRSENESDPGFQRRGPMTNEQVVSTDLFLLRNLNHRRYYTKIVSAAHGGGWRSEAGLAAERAEMEDGYDL